MVFDFYPLPLDTLPPWKKGRVIAIQGGHGLVRRLAHLGIYPGTVIRIVAEGPLHGPLLVEVDQVRVALGRGIARRILVQPLS